MTYLIIAIFSELMPQKDLYGKFKIQNTLKPVKHSDRQQIKVLNILADVCTVYK